MLKVQDLGELGYGVVVTAAGWWDNKRIASGQLTQKAFYKKAGFYAYWAIGLAATANSVWGFWRKGQSYSEHISHGFIYDIPRQVFNLIQSQRATPNMVAGDAAAALREAQAIINSNNAKMVSVRRVSQDRYLETVNPAPIETVPPSPVVTPQGYYGGRGTLG